MVNALSWVEFSKIIKDTFKKIVLYFRTGLSVATGEGIVDEGGEFP